MKVTVYGRLDGKCELCESAKKKLRLLDVPFNCLELADYIKPHEGWRDDESVEVMAAYQYFDTYPIFTIDGKGMSYPEAMKLLKSVSKPKPVVRETEPEPVMTFVDQAVGVGELVAVG